MIKPIRFLHIFGFLAALVFTAPVFAAGYSCPAYMKYNSCNVGYYMNIGGTFNGTPTVGNLCSECQPGCLCPGGTASPVCCAETMDSCVNKLGVGWSGTAYYRCPGQAWDYAACTHAQACTPTNGVSNAASTTCPGGTQSKPYNGSYGACSSTCTAATCNASFYKNGAACTACSSLGDGSFTTSNVGNSSGSNACYKSCSLACTRPSCQGNASCSYGSTSTSGTHIFNGTCTAAASTCSVTKTCNTGFYGDTNNAAACTACTNAKPAGASYTGNSAGNSCPWSNVTIPAGQYYQFSTKSFVSCPTGKYCPGGGSVNSSTGADTGIAGNCTNVPGNTTNWAYTGTGVASAGACPIQISSCNANYVHINNGTASATCTVCIACAPGTGTTCSLSVSSNVCTYATGCSTGYGSIQNAGKYNPSCSANTYTVTLNSQSGTGGTPSVIATYNSPMPAATMPTRANYSFLGYYDATSGGAQYYNASGASVRNWQSAAGATLYAQWNQVGSVCTAGQYLPRNATSCAACPAAASYCLGGTYTISASADQGITACPNNYIANTAAGKSSASQCQISVPMGRYIATPNDTVTTLCDAGYYCPGATINYGGSGSFKSCTGASYSGTGAGACTACPTGYTIPSSYAADHDEIKDCGITCPAGNYLATANAASCTVCLTGYTCPGSTFEYGASGGITANKYTVTLNDAPGSGGSGSVQVTFDLGMPTVTVPTRKNYTFTGYYTSGNAQYYTASGQSYRNWNIASNTTLNAQWYQSGETCAAGQYLPKNTLVCATCIGGNFCAGGTYTFNASLDQGTQNCPAGYTSGGAGLSAQNQCKISVEPGKYVAIATSTTPDTCIAGTAKETHLVAYGSTSSCAACTGTTYSAAGAGSCSNCPNGYIANTASNKTDAAQCQINVGGGQYMATAGSGGSVACAAGTSKAAHIVNYGSLSSCAACTGTTYSAAGAGSCSNCPNGYIANTDSNKADVSQCQISCAAGHNVSTLGAACFALTSDDSYVEEHLVNYGAISIINTCDVSNNYFITGKPNAEDHDSMTDCYQTCVMESIAPPTGSFKLPKIDTEYYPNFCVYQASCPQGYLPQTGGDKYDDSGYTSAPFCESTPFYVTFLPNGGNFTGTGLSYTKRCQVGVSCVLDDADLMKFNRMGFVFGGWSKTTGGAAVYQNGENIAGLEVLTTNLYANWAKCEDGYSWNGRSCTLCPIGSWAADIDAQGLGMPCTSCGAGMTTDATGSTSNEACSICPADNFCGINGGEAKLCLSVGDGSWANADVGSQTANSCYKACPDYPLIYGTAIAKNDTEFYPANCQYSCTSDTGNPGRIENGTCIEMACNNTYELVNGYCKPCNRENALSYKPAMNCVIETCAMGYHPNGQKCDKNIVECSAPNAIEAEQKWDFNSKDYGICTIKTCDVGYHISSNACVLDDQACAVENGNGMKEWDSIKNTWGKCVVASCNPGYSADVSDTNELSKPCGQCKNKFSVLGELAASSYTVGCEIAACMYQGELYNLDNNECVPICEVNGYEDETGSMKWDPSRKKCVRQCKEGYAMW